MGLRCGIIGLPNTGKTTLFNALTAAHAPVASYPFTTIEPNVGVVAVPDERLSTIARIYRPHKTTPATVEYVDIAGLVKGASRGEGLGNRFLAHIRDVDAILHVVRCFENSSVAHVSGSVDPPRDIEIVETELMLADLEKVDREIHKVEKKAKSGEKGAKAEWSLLMRIHETLDKGRRVQGLTFSNVERHGVDSLELLSTKPVLYVANIAEGQLQERSGPWAVLEAWASEHKAEVVTVCGKWEAELADLSPEERMTFLKELGLTESGLTRLIRETAQLLGLMTFYTVNEAEARAFLVPVGTKAPRAAGQVHSDMERGFIRAEVTAYGDLIAAGTPLAVREKGLLRIEGHDYEVRDGDILYFRFHV
jgi:GTP-binding protein YchF